MKHLMLIALSLIVLGGAARADTQELKIRVIGVLSKKETKIEVRNNQISWNWGNKSGARDLAPEQIEEFGKITKMIHEAKWKAFYTTLALDGAAISIESKMGESVVKVSGSNALPPGGRKVLEWLDKITEVHEWPFEANSFEEVHRGFDGLDEFERYYRNRAFSKNRNAQQAEAPDR